MGPSWGNWKANWWDSVDRREIGESDGVFPENLQMNPGLTK